MLDEPNSATSTPKQPIYGLSPIPHTDGHSNSEASGVHLMYGAQSLLDAERDPTASAVSTLIPETAVEIYPVQSLSPEALSEIGHYVVGPRCVSADLAPIIGEIIAEHMRRQAAMKAQKRLDQSAGAMARRLCGWRVDLDEKERGQLNKRAERIVNQIEKGADLDGDDIEVATQLMPFVMATTAARAPFDQLRKNAEKAMAARVKSLPIWPMVKDIRGFDAGGLAAIIGEAGDLSNYATIAKLWKRLGLAVMSGSRQGNPGKGATADDWIAHGYSGRRRSVVWNVGHALVMCNQDGPYRSIYLTRKEYEKERDPTMSKGHAANRAQRYMEKRLIRDLWAAWRKSSAPPQPEG